MAKLQPPPVSSCRGHKPWFLACFSAIAGFVEGVKQWLDLVRQWLTRWTSWEKNRAHAVIYPDRNVVIVLLVAVALWYAAASQNSALAYFLLFWLISLLLVSAVRTRANVASLQLTVRPGEPVFADENPRLVCELFNPSGRPRFSLKFRLVHYTLFREVVLHRIAPGETATVELELSPVKRGVHRFEAVGLESRFPFQVLIGRAWVPVHGTFLVYPKLAGALPVPEPRETDNAIAGETTAASGDDFYGVRKYAFGDSQRHVDWKAVARGHPLMTKQFGGSALGELWLDWRTLEELGFESRLSQLARWSCEAELAGQSFGLRLPRLEIPVGRGEPHLHECLRTLATYRIEP